MAVLSRMCRTGGHQFRPDSARLVDTPLDLSRLAAYRQVTDAHLVLVAAALGGRLVTFDSGIPELLQDSDRHLVEVVRLSS